MTPEIIYLFLAGITAGIVTGLFGGSATLTAVPLLVVFAGREPYMAIGIALAIDVFSSLAALRVYHSHDNVSLRPAILLISFALLGVLIGSIYSVNIPGNVLSILVGVGISFASIRFINNGEISIHFAFFDRYGKLLAAIWGLVGGLILGVFGGGGGVVILLALTLFLGYRTHTGIGTSIFAMVLIASAGAIGHYLQSPFTISTLMIGGMGGVIGAIASSYIANRMPERWLNRLVALALISLGVSLLLNGIGLF